MVNENILSNLGIIGIIVPAIIFQLTRICNSKKPELQSSGYSNVNAENYTNAELTEHDAELKKTYIKDAIVYYSVYWIPIIIALLTCLIFVNISIGLIFFITGMIAIILSVFITLVKTKPTRS